MRACLWEPDGQHWHVDQDRIRRWATQSALEMLFNEAVGSEKKEDQESQPDDYQFE
jgi:hypothetical protein